MSYGVKIRHAPPGGEHSKYKNKDIESTQSKKTQQETRHFKADVCYKNSQLHEFIIYPVA